MENDLLLLSKYLDENKKAMLELWRHLVEIESPSKDKEAVEKVASHLDTYLDAMGMHNQIFHFDNAGPTLVSTTAPSEKGAIALIGHMDTVHPVHSFEGNTFVVSGNKVTGPGVYDMKGGLVVAIFAIKALMHIKYNKRELRIIFSGDEEVAHSFSKGKGGKLFEKYAAGCSACFNCESGYKNKIVLERKGGAIFSIKVHGKAAHAGKEPEKGASAILQAAKMIVKIEECSSKENVLYNCGLIKGGKGANVIPDETEFSVGIRYSTNEQYRKAELFLKELCDEPFVNNTSCEITRVGFYPSLEKSEKSQKLLEEYQNASLLLGEEKPEGIKVGGCSDSAFTSIAKVPTLCSCGVTGDGAHTKHEMADLDSLYIQCKKLATTIYMLSDEF